MNSSAHPAQSLDTLAAAAAAAEADAEHRAEHPAEHSAEHRAEHPLSKLEISGTPGAKAAKVLVTLTSATVEFEDKGTKYHVFAGPTLRAQEPLRPRGHMRHFVGVISDPDVVRRAMPGEEPNVHLQYKRRGDAHVSAVRPIEEGEELIGPAVEGFTAEGYNAGRLWEWCLQLTPKGEVDRTPKLYRATSTLKVQLGCHLVSPGDGVFARKAIVKGEAVGILLGLVRTNREMRRTEKRLKRQEDETHFFSTGKGRFLDATDPTQSSIIRYINDPLHPDAYNVKYFVGPESEVYAVALRNIEPGEELFASFGHGAKTVEAMVKRRRTDEVAAHLVFHERQDGSVAHTAHYDRAQHFDRRCF
jgi:hypothetical protein